MSLSICQLKEWRAPEGAEVVWLQEQGKPRLRALVWRRRVARGTIFLFGGRTEFIEKYFEVVGELLDRGFAVAALDWQGQGLSDRLLPDSRKGHVEGFGHYEDDARRFFAEIAPNMPLPHIGFAHSMGGNVLLRSVRNMPEQLSGLIITAPLLGIDLSAGLWGNGMVTFASWAASSLGQGHRYVPGGGPQAADEIPFEENRATGDPYRYAVHQALVKYYPALAIGSPTWEWLHSAFMSMELVSQPDYLVHIERPMLVLLAEQEFVVDNHETYFSMDAVDNARLVTIEGAYHEIMMDRSIVRAQAWGEIDAFLEGLL